MYQPSSCQSVLDQVEQLVEAHSELAGLGVEARPYDAGPDAAQGGAHVPRDR
jgi:hypothetical protein